MQNCMRRLVFAVLWSFVFSHSAYAVTNLASQSILVITPMPEEAAAMTSQLENKTHVTIDRLQYDMGKIGNKSVIVAISGIGKINAALITMRAIHDFQPSMVILSGTAGALEKNIANGDVVLGQQMLATENLLPKYQIALNPLRADPLPLSLVGDPQMLGLAQKVMLPNKNQVISGSIATTDSFPQSMDLLRELHSQQISGIEMEGYAVMQVCWLMRLPCLVVRGVSDNSTANSDPAKINTVIPPEHIKLAAKNAALVTAEVIREVKLPIRISQ